MILSIFLTVREIREGYKGKHQTQPIPLTKTMKEVEPGRGIRMDDVMGRACVTREGDPYLEFPQCMQQSCRG